MARSNLQKWFRTVAAMVVAPTIVMAWGPEGHTVIAKVAFDGLSPTAKAKLSQIISGGVQPLNASHPGTCQLDAKNPLGPVVSFSDATTNLANYPDCIRYNSFTASEPWHFDDIPLCAEFDILPDKKPWCSPGGCLSDELPHYIDVLADPKSSAKDALEALAFVVHFIGDMHQPLHMEENNDRGGLKVSISVAKDAFPTGAHVSAKQLHALWDGPLVTVGLGDESSAEATIAAAVGASASNWTQNTDTIAGIDQQIKVWIADTHMLAKPAYDGLSPAPQCNVVPTGNVTITKDYVAAQELVASGQIAHAAARLKAVLNTILK